MFNKRNDEQEWTRRNAQPAARDRDEPEIVDVSAAPSTPAPMSPAGPSFRPSTVGDVNVTVPTRTPRPDSSLDSHDVESLIGERTSLEGNLKSEGAIRVLGTVKGELESKSAILIEEHATVTAKLVASQVTIAGKVEGQIFCQGRVEIRPSGRVSGEIQAGSLIVQEGAFFDGSSKMMTETSGSNPTPPLSNRSDALARATLPR